MTIDAQGYFWISHPAVAAGGMMLVIGLLLWCHRLLDAEATIAADVAADAPPNLPAATVPTSSHADHRPAA